MKRSCMRHVVMSMVLFAARFLLGAGGGSYVWTYEIIVGYEWRYTLYDDKATLVAAPQTINGRLDVPERFGIYPLVNIAPSAFAGRDDIKELYLPEGIVEIGYNAFQNCTNLTELVIPDTVQTIGGGAFGGCTSLKKLTIPFVGTNRGIADTDSRDRALRSQFGYMFYYTTSPELAAEREGMRIVPSGINYWGNATYVYYIPTNLEEVVVTDDTLITMKAFYQCEDIKRIAILGNVSEVEESAFEGCSSLEVATFADGLESLGYAAFKGCIRLKSETLASLPSSVKSIGDYAFAGCSSGMVDIVMPEGLTKIGAYAFQGCCSATNVSVSSTVSDIGVSALEGCIGLSELAIPDTVQTIGGGAFGGCTSLKKLTIPFVGTNRGMADTSSRDRALRSQFGYMFYITSPGLAAEREGVRIVPSGINYWGNATYVYYIPTNLEEVVVTDDTLITMKAFYQCEDIKRIAILGNVSEVEESAFEGCSSLEVATFADGLESLGYAAFKGCIRLKSETLASLPSSVKSIGDYAFAGCSSGMVDIVMPEGLTKIGAYAFQGCCSATNVSVSSTVSDIGVSALEGCIGLPELAIPDTVQTIGGGAFGGCTSLKKLTIPFVGTNRGPGRTTELDNSLRSQFGYMFLGAGADGARAVPSGISYRTYPVPYSLEEVVVTDDTLITMKAFYRCEDIKRIAILGNVSEVEESAFEGCSRLECLMVFGNKPTFGSNVFSGIHDSCELLVPRYSSGWDVPIPGTWNGLAIGYITDELLPEVSDEAAVAERTAPFVDARITANVKAVEQYDAFREWAYAVKLFNGALGGSQAVKDSPYAWLSFALGADRLIDRVIVPEDVRIVSFDAGSGDAKGALSFEVAIDDVEIGGGQVAMATLTANLAKVLGVEGAARLDKEAFSSDGIELSIGEPVDGKARFTIQAPENTGGAYFMRVMIRQ